MWNELVVVLVVSTVGFLAYRKLQGRKSSSKKKGKSGRKGAKKQHEGKGQGRNTLVGPPYPNSQLIVDSGGLMPFLHKAHSRYGSVCQVWLGEEACVSVTDPALLKHLQREGDRPRAMFAFLETLLGADNLQVYPTERAKDRRRLLLQAFSHSSIKRKFGAVREVARRLCLQWRTGDTVEVQGDLLDAGFRIAVLAALGVSEFSSAAEFRAHYDAALRLSFDSQFRELLAEERQLLQESTAALQGILRELRDSAGAHHAEELALILAQHEVPEEEADMLIAVMVLAAYHTSAVTISWTLWHLACAHDVQQRVRDELATVDLDSLERIEALPYLHATIQESMRLSTPGPFAARSLRKDLAVPKQDAVIRAGTTVIVPLQTIHLDPLVYPDPERFMPERFLEGQQPSRTYLPFGLGNRQCVGERFAWFEVKVLLAHLLKAHSFDVSQETPEKSVRFVQMAKDGIHLKVM